MEFHDDIKQPEWKIFYCRYCNVLGGYIKVKDLDPDDSTSIETCERCDP